MLYAHEESSFIEFGPLAAVIQFLVVRSL